MDAAAQKKLAQLAQLIDQFSAQSGVRRLISTVAHTALAKLLSHAAVASQAVDVLFLHSSEYVSAGKLRLIDHLKNEQKLHVAQYWINRWPAIFKQRQLIKPNYPVFARFSLRAALAAYLARRFQPRVTIMCTEDIIAPFIRHEMNQAGGVVVNIAHSLTFNSPLFAMSDFDYYFLFGRYSLENLRKNPVRYGSAQIVLTGSTDISCIATPEATQAPQEKTVTYFSTWRPKAQRHHIEKQFGEIAQFAKDNPHWRLRIKLHPLENAAYWTAVAKSAHNIEVISCSQTVQDSLQDCNIALCPSHSTTALDCAALGKLPIVLACDEDEVGSEFFSRYPELKRRNTESILHAIERVEQTAQNYAQIVQHFFEENISSTVDVPQTMSHHIMRLCCQTRNRTNEPIAGAIALEKV